LRQRIGKKIKKAAGDYPNWFVVDNAKIIPHLSLWHLRTGKGKISKLIGELRKITGDQAPIKIRSSGFSISTINAGAVVSSSVHRSKALASLQMKVFRKIYPIKTGMMPSFKPFEVWKGAELKQVKKYGRPLKFKPHFTMGWLKNKEDALNVQQEMRKMQFTFLAKEIYICRVNRWWQVDKVIREVHFN
jgi:hypothetical protein